jgi:poly(A) polymerase
MSQNSTRSTPNLPLPSLAKQIADALKGSPFQGNIRLVGGYVRDAILGGIEGKDIDLVTSHDAFSCAKFLFDCGLAHTYPVTYAEFGTAQVTIDGVQVEIVTARKEAYSRSSRKPKVSVGSFFEDCERRDFTLNCLAQDIFTGEVIDELGTGLRDLNERVLRTPLEPRQTFSDDPLRMLRAVRFKHRLKLEFAPGLSESICKEAHRLKIVSAERVREEFFKMLCHIQAPSALQDLMDLGLMDTFGPEFREGVGLDQGAFHVRDVWEHSLDVVARTDPNDLPLRLSALFHDVGKPKTRTIDAEGRIRFFGHAEEGATMTRMILNRWRCSRELTEQVTLLVANHMLPAQVASARTASVRRLMKKLGDQLDRLLQLAAADKESLRAGAVSFDLEGLRTRIEEIGKATPVSEMVSPLDGNEIAKIFSQKGPFIGRVKSFLSEQVIEGNLLPGDKETAKTLAIQKFGV